LTPDVRVMCAGEPEEAADEGEAAAIAEVQLPPSRVALRRASPEPGDGGKPDATGGAEQHALSAEEAITRMRAKIDHLGPVNMMAIEQFDELETRYAFLTRQRKDLVDSIAQTSEAIKRIDETTRQRFAEAFTAINLNFQETFSTLFGGGRAGLALVDENDPLESGIEIIAQPPGKRLQSVQLLSGGEKALTAIALMFGLFKYKPSPFCLLDEIDAPLDDANIGRFVEMLRAMQRHTQFILITHNRKTMEIADRLYGVTMEEPGVSKLISVQLN
jgi:chromosome segregation protein